MWAFLVAHGSEIGTLTIEHLWLTGAAMLIAAGIGIPLGILLTRHQSWAKPVLGVANILQTIPSLALFGFLLPLPWLGERAARIAITALTAYALLPILRNTYAGIRGVDHRYYRCCEGNWYERHAAAFQSGASAGGFVHFGWVADGDGDLRGHCDDCSGGRCGWAG